MLEIYPFSKLDSEYDLVQSMNRRAGKGNWFWAFRVGDKLYSWELGMQLYEDAYWIFLRQDINRVKKLVSSFNVFVHNRYDLEAKLNYKIQRKGNSKPHYADIALRRCLVRLGVWFKGKELLEVPGSAYCDKKVPFHLPYLVSSSSKNVGSWLDFNRVIVVAREIEDQYKLSEILIK